MRRSSHLTHFHGRPLRAVARILVVALALTAAQVASAACPTVWIPVVARTGGYTTGLSVENGTLTGANLTLTYYHTLTTTGQQLSKSAPLWVGGRQTLSFTDVIGTVISVPGSTVGSIGIAGDTCAIIAAASLYSPSGSSKLPALNENLPGFLVLGRAAQSVSGLARNAQYRTNLILSGLGRGPSATVDVKVFDAAGTLRGSRSFLVGGRQYLQINDVFGPTGVGLPAGDYTNMRISAQVVAGGAAVAAVTTMIDNWTGVADVELAGAVPGFGIIGR